MELLSRMGGARRLRRSAGGGSPPPPPRTATRPARAPGPAPRRCWAGTRWRWSAIGLWGAQVRGRWLAHARRGAVRPRAAAVLRRRLFACPRRPQPRHDRAGGRRRADARLGGVRRLRPGQVIRSAYLAAEGLEQPLLDELERKGVADRGLAWPPRALARPAGRAGLGARHLDRAAEHARPPPSRPPPTRCAASSAIGRPTPPGTTGAWR